MRYIGTEAWGMMIYFIDGEQNNVNNFNLMHIYTSLVNNKEEKNFNIIIGVIFLKSLPYVIQTQSNYNSYEFLKQSSNQYSCFCSSFPETYPLKCNQSHLSEKQNLSGLFTSKPSMSNCFPQDEVQNFQHKEETHHRVSASFSNFIFYSSLHLYNLTYIIQNNATLLILKCKVFHEELTPSFLFSPFLYPPFFGLYTPAMINTCCFPTHHFISFIWAFVHVSLLPQFPIHPILHLTNL